MTTTREAFESWYSDNGANPKAVERKGESYKLAQVSAGWWAWQAAWQAATLAEREACASLCDRFANRMMTAEECADAIRQGGDA